MTDPTTPDVLLPCPFCGDAMYSFAGSGAGAFACSKQDGTLAVNCECGAMGPFKPTEAEAIEAWNTRALARPSPQASDTMIEAGRKELLRYEDREDITEILPRIYAAMIDAMQPAQI